MNIVLVLILGLGVLAIGVFSLAAMGLGGRRRGDNGDGGGFIPFADSSGDSDGGGSDGGGGDGGGGGD